MTKARWRLAKKQLQSSARIFYQHEPLVSDRYQQRRKLYKDWVKLIMYKTRIPRQ
jgi:hypothetical protein